MSYGFGYINDLVDRAHRTAKGHGHWDGRDITNVDCILAKLDLIHSEVSEGTEAARKFGHDNLEEELADICIRVFDLAGALEFNLEQAIINKMAINETRPHKHGKKA